MTDGDYMEPEESIKKKKKKFSREDKKSRKECERNDRSQKEREVAHYHKTWLTLILKAKRVREPQLTVFEWMLLIIYNQFFNRL